MKDILQTIESLAAGRIAGAGKSPVKDLGFISCASHVYIRHVPFYHPSLRARESEALARSPR